MNRSTTLTMERRDPQTDADAVQIRGLLRSLLRIQTELHAVLRSKLDAMKRGHLDGMRAAGARVLELTNAFGQIDLQRVALVARLAAAHGVPADESFRLSALIAAYPLPLRSELTALALALRQRMLAVADANQVVAAVSREMVEHFRIVFEAMTHAALPPAGYNRGGRSGPVDATMLDARG